MAKQLKSAAEPSSSPSLRSKRFRGAKNEETGFSRFFGCFFAICSTETLATQAIVHQAHAYPGFCSIKRLAISGLTLALNSPVPMCPAGLKEAL